MLMCMCMLTKRAQILFKPETWQLLQQVSRANNVSTSELIRQSVIKTHLNKNTKLTNKQLLADIKKTWKSIKNPQKPIDYKALINHGRKY